MSPFLHLARARADDLAASGITAFRLYRWRTPDGYYLVIVGEADFGTNERLRRVLGSIPADTAPLTLDLTQATYIDCTTVRLLLETQQAMARQRAVTFRFAGSGQARQVIHTLGLEQQFGLLSLPVTSSQCLTEAA